MRKLFTVILFSILFAAVDANAQFYAADEDAAYLAIVKAAADFKINDEETLDDMERLRQSQRFNEEVYRIVQDLDNSRGKNSKNKRVLKILQKAGKDIYNIMR